MWGKHRRVDNYYGMEWLSVPKREDNWQFAAR